MHPNRNKHISARKPTTSGFYPPLRMYTVTITLDGTRVWNLTKKESMWLNAGHEIKCDVHTVEMGAYILIETEDGTIIIPDGVYELHADLGDEA